MFDKNSRFYENIKSYKKNIFFVYQLRLISSDTEIKTL